MSAQTLTRPSAHERAGMGRVARGGALNLLGAGFSATAGFAATWLVAKGLGQTEAGVLFAATSAFLVSTVVAKLGTTTGLVYWLARLRALGRVDLMRRCVVIALRPVVLASALASVGLWWAAPLLRRSPDFVSQVRLVAFFVPLAVLSDALLAATRGYRTMRATVLVEKLARPALQVAVLGAVLLIGGATGAYTLAWIAPYALSAALAAAWLAHVMRTQRPARPARVGVGHIGWEFWSFTGPRALASLAQLALQRLDVLLVAALLGFAPAAVYTVAARFVVAGQFANQAIATAVEPRLAELLAAADLRAANALYQDATAWVVLLVWPVYLGVAAFAPAYLSLFGHGYAGHGALAVVVIMAAAGLLANASGMVDVVLAMAGRTGWNMANVTLALIVNVGLNLLLIPRIGIAGAAWAWFAALAVKNAVPLVQIAVTLRIHPFGKATLLSYPLGLVCFGGVGLAARVLFGAGLVGCAATVVVAVPLYAAAVWALRGPLHLSAFAALRRTPRRTARHAAGRSSRSTQRH
jgi:O-antigen/teichoic acid export membrane protein